MVGGRGRTAGRGPVRGGPSPALRSAAACAALAALLAGAAACAGPERTRAPVPEDVYVQVMARLAVVDVASDPARAEEPLAAGEADSIRSRVLGEFGVTRAELREFARRVGDEPARMEALWTRIAARGDSLARAGWPRDVRLEGARRRILGGEGDTSGTSGRPGGPPVPGPAAAPDSVPADSERAGGP